MERWAASTLRGIKTRWVAQKILEIERLDRYAAPLVLEGGAIHTDGAGTLLTTEECLLNPNRNPNLSRREIEAYLRAYLGIEKIIWLGQGVYRDETNGHVDNLCCFVRPGVVALTWTDDRADPQYPISQDAYKRLTLASDARGRPLEVVKLPQPDPLFITAEESAGVQPAHGTLPRRAGDRLAASYVNFYIANGGVIAPTFDDPIRRCGIGDAGAPLPRTRASSACPAREILLGGGNIHCITQQQPAARESPMPNP